MQEERVSSSTVGKVQRIRVLLAINNGGELGLASK